ADVSLQATGTAYIYGKRPGATTIYASSKKGENVLNLEVQVTHNMGALKRAIARSYPNEDVEIISTPSGVILEGEVSSPKASKDIVNIVKRFIAGDDDVVNNMGVTTPSQVYLQVKIAEVNRTVLKQLDISWGARSSKNVQNFAFGLLTGRALQENLAPQLPTTFTRADPLNSLTAAGIRGENFTASSIIDALNTEGLATILAEPNLIALSGETAKVLVGGEVPYLVPQGSSTVSVEFKQYGTSLDFTPTILSSNRINLRVRPEVSQLDPANKVTLRDVSVSSFKTRRAETSVEMGSGDSLVIAGLYSSQDATAISGVPGLQDIPVLGALFRSTKFTRDETELVIMVTPILVEPLKKNTLASPLKGLKHATHLGLILGNRLNRVEPEVSAAPAVKYTNDTAATEESATAKEGEFEQTLANTTATEASVPAETVTEAAAKTSTEAATPDYEVNLVGEAGFYTR
ncbi:MAG: type II and III secretion system protein family protein, partial [Alphaproteobacteria bacterium]|nr:type II and III secretion system protein family protein [Alphaproteobacteria bacterium]